jgi:hypothetical protein
MNIKVVYNAWVSLEPQTPMLLGPFCFSLEAKGANVAGLSLRGVCNTTSQFSSAPLVEALEHLPPLLLRTAFD